MILQIGYLINKKHNIFLCVCIKFYYTTSKIFEGDSPVDIKVKILSREGTNTISGQYIGFCRTFYKQCKIYDNKLEFIKETLCIYSEKGYLVPYLKNREKETVTMMSELFDEEYLRKQYDLSERKKTL